MGPDVHINFYYYNHYAIWISSKDIYMPPFIWLSSQHPWVGAGAFHRDGNWWLRSRPRVHTANASALRQLSRVLHNVLWLWFPYRLPRWLTWERGSAIKSQPLMHQEMQETWVWFLGGEDVLEKEMAAHSSILAWKIPWTEEPGGLQSMGHTGLDMTEQLSTHTQFL